MISSDTYEDENPSWAMIACPEREIEMGETHEPRMDTAKLLPAVSPHQVEIELEVECLYCGAKGIATLELDYSHVVRATGETR